MKMLVIVATVLFLSMTLNSDRCESYRILGIFPLGGRSHFMMFEVLMKGLARKGHQVDVVSTFPQKKPYPNYTDVVKLEFLQLDNLSYSNVIKWSRGFLYDIATLYGNDLCNDLEHPKMLKIIKSPPKDPPYDLVITQFLSAHCFLAFGYHLKVPTIAVSTTALYPWLNGIIGNPANLAFVPNNLIPYAVPMNFWQRVYNTFITACQILYIQYYTRSQDDIIKKYFGDDAPGIRELERNIALVLTNSHPALNGPKPVTTALIEVGGLHIQDDGPELSQDIVEWMDNSTEGFVYFTFGSMMKIESFPEKTILTLYKSLGRIAPIRVLMRISEPERLPPGVPNNFRFFPWISQYKVLKHKNVKAFITHGGQFGTQEATYCGVPMIGIPLFADQYTNVNLYVSKKIAVKVDFNDITEEKMDKALNEILYNPVYKNTMLDVSAKFIDRPMSPLDTATWWVEYIIRHGGSGVRSPAMDLAWWQIDLLDVYAMLLLIAAFAVFITILIVRLLIRIYVTTIGPTVPHKERKKVK